MAGANLWALGALIIGLAMLWLFLVRLIRGLTYKPDEDKKAGPPASVSFLTIILAVILLGVSWVLYWTGHQLRSFKPVNFPGAIGRVEAVNEHDPLKTLKVDFYSFSGDSLSKPTNFYLTGNSYRLSGQFIRLPGFLKHVFGSRYYCKITDFWGEYIGHKPPGFESTLFDHQQIGGGQVEVFEYISLFPFVKKLLYLCEFESEPLKVDERGTFELALSDTCQVSILEAE